LSSRSIIASKPTLPPPFLSIAGALLVFGILGPNSLLAVLAVVVLFLGGCWLWRPGESSILFFVLGFQWLQASIKVFQANWLGVDVAKLTAYYGADIQLATVLSLLALVALISGMRLGVGRWRSQDGALARSNAWSREPAYWFRLYAAALLIATFVQSVAWVIPGLAQPLLALATLKWAFYWMLAYATFVQFSTSRLYWLLAFGLEMLIGLGGYFSDFKTVLFFTLMAVAAAGVRLSVRHYLGFLALATAALSLALVWTAVKGDYRKFVNAGTNQQIVTVGYLEGMSKLADLVTNLDGDAMSAAAENLLDRLSYVDFFGIVLNVVPSQIPYADGSLWRDAIIRPFMPRFFFPEKSAIDDSVRTSYYTGLKLAGAEQGTSISLGYVAESYIDFGVPGMMVPVFALGLLLGSFYRWMLRLDPARRLLGMALATATVYGASFLESSITKVFGGLIVTMFVSWGTMRFIAPLYVPRTQSEVVR
jgi:hypothetical protein